MEHALKLVKILVLFRKVPVLYWYRCYTRYYTRSTGTQLPRIKVLSSFHMILHYPSFEYNTATYETAVFALFLLEVSSHLIQRESSRMTPFNSKICSAPLALSIFHDIRGAGCVQPPNVFMVVPLSLVACWSMEVVCGV